mmetsp:Transcript_19198/g.40023  ORF Transcript_19198/g.40023 Transcript_19198/m.40023 type:complete len:221 (-) Transcript_19198:3878-4540(-)
MQFVVVTTKQDSLTAREKGFLTHWTSTTVSLMQLSISRQIFMILSTFVLVSLSTRRLRLLVPQTRRSLSFVLLRRMPRGIHSSTCFDVTHNSPLVSAAFSQLTLDRDFTLVKGETTEKFRFFPSAVIILPLLSTAVTFFLSPNSAAKLCCDRKAVWVSSLSLKQVEIVHRRGERMEVFGSTDSSRVLEERMRSSLDVSLIESSSLNSSTLPTLHPRSLPG